MMCDLIENNGECQSMLCTHRGFLVGVQVVHGPLAEVVAEKGLEIRRKLNLPPTATAAEVSIEQKRVMRRSALGFPSTATD